MRQKEELSSFMCNRDISNPAEGMCSQLLTGVAGEPGDV